MSDLKNIVFNDLPTGWVLSTLGEHVAKRARGIVPDKTPDETFELYSVPSHENRRPEIVQGKEIGSNKQLVEEGTVLLCKINPRINRTWVVGNHSSHQRIASTEWITFPPCDMFEPRYLAYYMRQDTFREFLAGNASGVGGSLMRVKPATITDYPFPIAPVEHQTRIVAEIEKQFSRLDEAVANLKRVKANLKRYKAAVLKAAVEGKLTEEWRKKNPDVEPADKLLERILAERRDKWQGRGKYKEPVAPDASGLPKLPEGWVWASVEQLTRFVTSGSRGWGGSYSETGPLFIRAQDIKTDNLIFENVARVNVADSAEGTRSSVSNHDILITITGANVTKSALVKGLGEQAFVSQHVALLKPCISPVSTFMFCWIVSPANGRRHLENWAYGAGKPGLSLEQIRRLQVPFPPLAEQHQIVAEVDRCLSIVTEAEAQIDANIIRAGRLHQSILKQAFSGRLVPRDQ